MSKIISVLLCFLLITSNVNAGALNESFPAEMSGIIVIDSSIVKHLFDVNSETSALTDCYSGINHILKEKFGIDFDKQVEQLGYLLFLENNKIQTLGFISGNFKINEIISSVSKSLVSETESLENVELNDKIVPTLKTGNNRIVFYNNKLIWFCDEYEFKYFKEKSFSLGKAPEHIVEISDKSKTFISLNKELWAKLFGYNPQNITFDLDSVNAVSAYLDNSDIVFTAHLDINHSAEVLRQQFDYFFKIYKDSKKQDSLIDENNYTDLSQQINSLYLSSRIIDIINSLKFEVKDKNLVIHFPYNRDNFYNAISDFIMNIAMPAYQRAIEENYINDCYYTQHYLTKAVEKYNNENEPMLYYLDIQLLKNKEYFPYGYTFHEKRGCQYKAVGHLDNGGYIICKEHGPAVPLIKPCYSKERLAQEEDMLKCIFNKKLIEEAVQDYNYNKPDSEPIQAMETKLDLELLKKEEYLESDLFEISGCEYYISESKKGTVIGCKKHGLLTNAQSYENEYDYYFRRPEITKNKSDYRTLEEEEIEKAPLYDEDEDEDEDKDKDEVYFHRNYKTLKKELESSFIAESQNDNFFVPCQNNMKNINYALEMYNMDNAVIMTKKLDLSTLEKGYLRTPLEEVSSECEYYIYGDLSRNGCVACKKHGPKLDSF